MAFDPADDMNLIYVEDGETTAATLTFTPGLGQTTATAYGFFDKAHQALDMENVSVTSAGPRFRCLSSAVTSFNRDADTVTISSVAYKVKAIEPIGTGQDCFLVLGVD